MKKVGMVLEGGGLRGLYTAGVLDTLMNNNIKIDGIVGTSAGALFGVNYYSNQKGRVLRYNKKYCNDKRYMSIPSFLLTGNYINKNFAFYKMSNELDKFDNDEYIKEERNFYAVLTDIETGKPEYIKITNPIEQMEYLRATSAIPVISKIVKIDNKKYLDGGVSDSIALSKLESLDYKKIIVVETQPKDYRKTPFSKTKERFIKLRYFRYPKLVDAIINRYKNYNKVKEEIIEKENNKEIFVIRPSRSLGIDMKCKNETKYQEIYDLGVKDTKKVLNDLKKYIKWKEY